MPTWLMPTIMLIIALLAPLLSWWGSSRYFAGMMNAQQKAAETWREMAEQRLGEIEKALRESSYAVLKERVDHVQADINALRTWRHQVDPYIKRRIDP